MPIYQYLCDNGHKFEVLQKMSDSPLEKCQLCAARAQRQISLFNNPHRAGVYLFSRDHGNKDILHDPTFSSREREKIISEIAQHQ